MKFESLKSSGHNCIFLVNCELKNNILKAGFAHFPQRINNSHQKVSDGETTIKVIIPCQFINLKQSAFSINLELKLDEPFNYS
jgi:hypothetical protein